MVGLVWACCRCPWSARVSGTPSCFGNTFLFRGHLHHGAFVGLTCITVMHFRERPVLLSRTARPVGSGVVEPDSLAAPGVDRGGVDASRSDLVAIEHRDGGERPVAAGTVAAAYAAPGIHASPAGNRRLNPHHGDPALSGRPDHVRWLSGRVGSRCRRMGRRSRPATGSPACRLRRGRRSSRAVKGRREGVTRRSGRLGRGGAGDRDGDQRGAGRQQYQPDREPADRDPGQGPGRWRRRRHGPRCRACRRRSSR